MKIVHFSETPLSGAPYRLMMVQRKEGHESRLIGHRGRYSPYSNVVYPHDILLQRDCLCCDPKQLFPYDEVEHLIHNADILHFHNNFTSVFLFRIYPKLKELLKGKHIAFQTHSPRASLPFVEVDIRDKRVSRKLVVAQFQAFQFKDSTPVPNAVDIDDEIYSPKTTSNDNPHVVYSPSNTTLPGWNNKGFKETFKILKGQSGITSDIITNTPHLKCIVRKRQGDIAIDEVMTGSYHLCTLEGLSQGQAVLCNVSPQTLKTVLDLTGAAEFPVVLSTLKTLKENLNQLVKDPHLLQNYKQRSRLFMETYWNSKEINRHYEKAYS